MKKVSIGGGQGFWGDSPDAAIHMVRHGSLNYMACDYLAELTLSIMQRQKLKNPRAGYARDFIQLMDEIGQEAWEKNIRILTNAGGMNILGAVDALREMAHGKGLQGYRIGYVTGDDLLDRIPQMIADGCTFENMDGAGDFNEIKDKLVNANVYYGREPLMECLSGGRCGGDGAGFGFRAVSGASGLRVRLGRRRLGQSGAGHHGGTPAGVRWTRVGRKLPI